MTERLAGTPKDLIALDCDWIATGLRLDCDLIALAGTAKDVSDVPITLRIYRRDLDDLDLIDLPGITRVAVAGQSMPDVELEQRIKQMCLQYMAPESCIVLNVVSAPWST
jgi:hypothetical protein